MRPDPSKILYVHGVEMLYRDALAVQEICDTTGWRILEMLWQCARDNAIQVGMTEGVLDRVADPARGKFSILNDWIGLKEALGTAIEDAEKDG